MSQVYQLIILLVVLIAVGLFILVLRNIKKVEAYEEDLELIQTNYTITRDSLQTIISEIRELDAKQIFERDDEVGVVFTQIKEQIERIDNILEQW